MKKIILIFLLLAGIAGLKAQTSPIGFTDLNFGLGFSNTTLRDFPFHYTGEGVAVHVHTSLLGMILNGTGSTHRVVIGDYFGSDLFLGARETDDAAASAFGHNSLGKHFYWGGSIEFGFQAYVRIVKDLDVGAKLFYSANVDNTRSIGNTGNDDNQVIKLQGRFKRVMLEYGTKTMHMLFFKSTKESLTQNYKSMCVKYMLDMKTKTHIGLKLDYYFDPGAPDTHSGGFDSYNLRIFYGMMF